MRYLFTMACLLLATGVVADEGDFDFSSLGAKKALRDYKKALVEDKKAIELKRKKFDEEAESLAKTTRDAFVENLKKALKKSMQSGNLDEANKINAAIKALEQGTGPAGGSVAGSKGKKKAKKSKARIPKNAIKWNGHHYLVSNINASHTEAKRRCEIAGGHLVRIENASERDFIAGLASKGGQRHYWIDGSDRKREGNWLFSDGTRMKFVDWGKGEPQNLNNAQHWLFIFPSNGKFADVESWRRDAGFIGEWDE